MRNTLLFAFLCGLPAALFGQSPEMPPSVLPAAAMNWDEGPDPIKSRLFRTTTSRTQIDLGGWWDFISDPDDRGESQRYFGAFPKPETSLWVPGTWNSSARYWNYVGPGWYRRRFETTSDGNLRICFGSVFYRSKVWLDGKPLGEHEGGYLPFSYVVPASKAGSHTLVVQADNRLDERSLPKENVDWFPYGGIDRPVYAEIVAPVFVERLHVIPVGVTAQAADLKVKLALRNLGPADSAERIAFSIDGVEVYSRTHSATPGISEVVFSIPLKQPRLWSPEHPNLYSARIVLGPGRDDQITRFGVRVVRAQGGRILLNGARIKLKGANRHEDHPDWGSASPPHLVQRDIEILKRLGANAVRAHYPLPELFMDYCDQYGLLFMAEAPAWQYSPEQLRDAKVQEKILKHVEEMVARDMNHPSVLSWSLGNEWPKPDASYEIIRSLLERARTYDDTRLMTLITGGPHVWRVHELLDVICVNWARYQWYDPFTTLDRAEGEKSVAELALIHSRYPDKPVILTEFGGSESQAGWHNWGNVKWSEEFQARNVADSGWHALDQDWISGGCVWQFSDSRSAPERFLAGRLHGWNGKGIVDAHRSPKLAFYELQRVFRSDAVPAVISGGR
ncbi:MAG TPA: glycoside hydrolase family 2 TIM barrel-domain containing protein [Bryobacteraceae bacterium]|nr:glycoside hydrolase family 2 TIM barrel-domain containing protein [Bryobacteraceae bacterium]